MIQRCDYTGFTFKTLAELRLGRLDCDGRQRAADGRFETEVAW
jgi:hypothetical protein